MTEHNSPVPPEPVRREPIFNTPAILVLMIGLMAAIHLVRVYLLSPEQERDLVILMAFLPARYVHPLLEQDPGWFVGPVGYSLLHGGALHLIFNCLWLAVFATPLARRIGTVRFLLLWVFSAVFSAFFHAFMTGFEPILLIGASGVVSATVGAACRFSMPLSGTGLMRYAHLAPRLGIIEALKRRPVQMFIALWALSNVLVLWGIGAPAGSSNIAWQAHLGGFLFGYLFFAPFDRKMSH
ncbi:rhomboid family intramembrane serine protease [Rhizobium alvei]|uniref:Rhomboid family intramembrane serine protease n=1 Tax=Rhizobium alvei TaxID=1132659 RepID=A0ABT8YKB8_9HYPH|nr:rhomboid family intramembrane serine protease [Rhizobium alvei]MDO6964049.1 rhomboid family intramembrane serine protease [Rhizobium alvei]